MNQRANEPSEELSSSTCDARRVAAIEDARRQFEAARPRTTASQRGLNVNQGSASGVDRLANLLPSYEIGPEIHRGGQGTVYKSTQRGTQRHVAIKLMHETPFDDVRAMARFEREIQILGQLKHPNIVTIHESGSATNGFYFVMDYIDGDTLDAYVIDNELGVHDTLILFAKICDAVNVAHLRGVIHRDLKPANIRVDRAGEPHVLDFGLAKVDENDVLADDRSVARSMTGHFIGSLPWASPEQVASDPGDIDVRTDVYSLGVMLFQILTRRFPYEVVGSARHVLDNICQADPLPPGRFRSDVDSEVDAIVMTCLRKDKKHRYQSAGDLARDIYRYVAGQPIEAKRDNGWYVIGKQIRRYRVAAAIASMFLLVVIAGLATSLAYWRQAVRDRDAAVIARMEADRSNQEARAQEAVAKAVVGFLTRDVLEKLDPYNTQGKELSARSLFDQASVDVEAGAFHDQPPVEFEIRSVLGLVYIWMSQFESAEIQLRPALKIARQQFGAENEKTLQTMRRLGTALSNQGKTDEAEPLLREALQIQSESLGEDHLSTILSRSALAHWFMDSGRPVAAEPLYRATLASRRRIQGFEHPNTLAVMSNLAGCLVVERKFEEAEELLKQAIEIKRRVHGDEHPETQLDVMQYAGLLSRLQRHNEALELAKEARETLGRTLGPDHHSVQDASIVLAQAYEFVGNPDEAETLYNDVLAHQREKGLGSLQSFGTTLRLVSLLGRQNRWGEAEAVLRLSERAMTSRAAQSGGRFRLMSTLINVLRKQGKSDESLAVASDVVQMCRRVDGAESRRTVIATNNYALALLNAGRPQESASLFREALDSQRRMSGDDDLLTLNIMHNLALALGQLGQNDERESLLRDALRGRRASLGNADPLTLKTIHALASALREQDKFDEAELLYREAVTIADEIWPDGHTLAEHYRRGLGACLTSMSRYDEAETLLLLSYQRDSARLRMGHPNLIEGLEKLVALYEGWGKPEKVGAWKAKLAASYTPGS